MSFKLNKIVLIPKRPENTHIKETDDEIGVWNITQPNIPDNKNNSKDHAKLLNDLVNLYVRKIDAESKITHVNDLENTCKAGKTIEKNGSMKIITIIAPNPPTATILITSLDLPCNTILWPGRTDVAVPSSGTPNNIDGTNSIIAWEIDIVTITTHKNSGEKILSKKVEDANMMAPAVLTWIPGIIPVTHPIIMPKKDATINSNILINYTKINLKFV